MARCLAGGSSPPGSPDAWIALAPMDLGSLAGLLSVATVSLVGAALSSLYSRMLRRRSRPALSDLQQGNGTIVTAAWIAEEASLSPDDAAFSSDLVASPWMAETMSATALEVDALKRRLAEVEARFPDQSTIDKVASVNDAILATKVEHLEAEVKRLETRIDDMPTKWDIATIVFAVIASLGVLVGAGITVIRWISGV